jgi:hypothetical protein
MMPKSSRSSKYYPSNQLQLFLEEKPEWKIIDLEYMLIDSDVMYCRVLTHLNRIDFGIRKGFDRWANSVEYFYNLQDYEINSYEDAFERAEYAYKNKIWKENFTPICLNELNLRRKK